MDIREEVNSYKTKHKHGFTRDEYMKLLENYPDINMERFWDALWYYQRIDDETVVFHRDIELAIRCGMDAMYKQLKIEVNASETQKYYKSKEVQDLDNPTDVVDEYESMGNLDKMSIKNQNGFFAKPMLLAVISFFMRNLEFIPLCFALQFWFDAGNRWEYWVTVFLVGTFSGISTAYNKYNNY